MAYIKLKETRFASDSKIRKPMENLTDLNPKTSGRTSCRISSGGHCPEMLALEVMIEKQKKEAFKKKTELALTVRGSYEIEQRILLQSNSNSESGLRETAMFHYPRDYGTEMTACVNRVYSSFDVTFSSETENDGHNQTTVPLTLISPMENETNIQIPSLEVKPLKAQIKVKECPEKLDVRLGFDLCDKEKMFLHKRQQVVGEALKQVLQLEKDLVGEEIPVIAVMATGGGARAMSSLYSHLCGLQRMGLLDCITYIAGASGSTWTMSKLYEDPEWSQKELSDSINNAKKQVTKKKIGTFSMQRLKYYRKELQQAAKNGQKTSFTDLWGLMIESMFHNGRNESRLSDQQAALDNGQNPLPIYLAMNVKQDTISTLDFKDKEDILKRRESAHLKTRLFTPPGTVNQLLKGVLTNRPIDGEQQNFLKGLHLHKDYHQHSQFTTWKDSSLDIFPNKLTPLADNLCLVDAGYFINASFPPLLRTERKVDIILSFDYTLDTPLQAVEQTCTYCTTQGICFPRVSLSEEDRKKHKECYIFKDEDNPNAPIVLHFPLVNDTFRMYKEPGVLRTSEEMSDGDVDVTGAWSPYFLTNFTYSERDFDRLMKLTQYNLLNNEDLILKALSAAVERRKTRNFSSKMCQTQTQQKTA
ncbi:cytosolic phospholipase A2 delta-like [Pyxicephalus adspersus]|uniref:cytosolic phospholipase A2 delta-like n=1 Tax=Pyxicephalus adspersus TaxID=30357 RepID=UPI003B5CBB95